MFSGKIRMVYWPFVETEKARRLFCMYLRRRKEKKLYYQYKLTGMIAVIYPTSTGRKKNKGNSLQINTPKKYFTDGSKTDFFLSCITNKTNHIDTLQIQVPLHHTLISESIKECCLLYLYSLIHIFFDERDHGSVNQWRCSITQGTQTASTTHLADHPWNVVWCCDLSLECYSGVVFYHLMK